MPRRKSKAPENTEVVLVKPQRNYRREVIMLHDDMTVFALYKASVYPRKERTEKHGKQRVAVQVSRDYFVQTPSGTATLTAYANWHLDEVIRPVGELMMRYGDKIEKVTYCEMNLNTMEVRFF